MDKIASSGRLDKAQAEVQEAIGAAIAVEANIASIAQFPPDQQVNAADWFANDGYCVTLRGAFQNLCKVASGKAWLQRFKKIVVNAGPAPANQTVDTVFAVQVEEPILNINVWLRASHSLRSAYNARALEEALVAALPQLKTGQDMDKITSSGRIDKTQKEIQEAIGNPNLLLEVDLYSITNMPQEDCRNASDFVSCDGLNVTFRGAFQNLGKVGSGKAWLSRFQKIVVTFVSDRDQKTDTTFKVSAAEPILTIFVGLRTSHSLRSAYNARALEDAMTASLPQLKTGQSLDSVTSSGKLEKTQKEVQDAIGNPNVVIDFNLFSIANMNPEDCKNAADWVSCDGYAVTFRGAFQSLCKIGSGKAWLQQFQKIAINAVSDREQKTDTVFDVQAMEPVLVITVSLRTSHSLRSAYNARALEDSLVAALPQLKTGQDMDKITSSGRIDKTQKEIQEAIGNPNLLLEVDLYSITNMPQEDCRNASDFVSCDGLNVTFRGAFQNLCKFPSGKGWLQRYQKVAVSFVADRDQKTDTVFSAVTAESALAVTVVLRTSHSLRSAYNARALEDAIVVAIPQLKTGQEMDKITSSGKLDQAQKSVRDAVGNQNLLVEVDLQSVANMPAIECQHCSDYFANDGWAVTARSAFANLAKKPNFASFMSQFGKVLVTPSSNLAQDKDSIFTVVPHHPSQGILELKLSLKANRSLRSAYDSRSLEEAFAKVLM